VKTKLLSNRVTLNWTKRGLRWIPIWILLNNKAQNRKKKVNWYCKFMRNYNLVEHNLFINSREEWISISTCSDKYSRGQLNFTPSRSSGHILKNLKKKNGFELNLHSSVRISLCTLWRHSKFVPAALYKHVQFIQILIMRLETKSH